MNEYINKRNSLQKVQVHSGQRRGKQPWAVHDGRHSHLQHMAFQEEPISQCPRENPTLPVQENPS